MTFDDVRIGEHICSDCREQVTCQDHASVDKRLTVSWRGIGMRTTRVRHMDCARGLRRVAE